MKTSVFGLETTFYLLIVSKLISLPFQRCIIVLIKYLKWLSYVKIKQSAFFTKNASFLLHFLTFSLRISVMNKLRALKIWIFLSQNVYFREKNTKKYLEKVTFFKLGHPMYHSVPVGEISSSNRSMHKNQFNLLSLNTFCHQKILHRIVQRFIVDQSKSSPDTPVVKNSPTVRNHAFSIAAIPAPLEIHN